MRRRIQVVRRSVQLAALALIVVVAVAAAQRAAPRAYGESARASAPYDALRGTTWSFELGPLSLTDPLAGADALAASRSLSRPLLVGLAIPVLATVLLGRVFCSWICPAGLLLEMTDRLRSLMGGASRRRNVGFWRGNKYVLLAVGLLGSAVLSVPLIGYLYPPAVLARELHGWAYALSLGSEGTWQRALTAAGAALLGLVAVEVFISRRMWCRYLCPGGALYSLLGARRLIKVTPPDERCDQCGLCVTECGMGLNPMAGITGVECDNCLACLSHCPPDALHLGTGTRTDGVT